MKRKISLSVILLLFAVFYQSCKCQQIKRAKDGLEIATIKDMVTHIGMDDYQRKRTGYDSIQLLIESGKITANFCYPNVWFMQKDTVYTNDTTYKKWWQVIQLTPNIILATKNDTMATFRNGFIDMGNGYFDSITVQNYRIKVTKVVTK